MSHGTSSNNTSPDADPKGSPAAEQVDFGLRKVAADDKAHLVGEVFRAVAPQYDLMNDIMSLGTHRLLKRMTVDLSGVRTGHRVLDVAGGTGDLTERFARVVGPTGQVILSDINPAMLAEGRDRLLNRGIGNVQCLLADAEALPFPDDYFDCAVIGFGLRNVTRKQNALREMCRVLRPNGCCLVLEFSTPTEPLLKFAYDGWQKLWPGLGRLITGEAEPYQYLVESIAVHPDQESLAEMMRTAGFARVKYENLQGGIVALHIGKVAPD